MFILVLLILGCLTYYILYKLCIIPHDYYYNSDFGIKTYVSKIDKDNDGLDDQTDILHNAKKYIAINFPLPKKLSACHSTSFLYDQCAFLLFLISS